jgi:hypothetical protein
MKRYLMNCKDSCCEIQDVTQVVLTELAQKVSTDSGWYVWTQTNDPYHVKVGLHCLIACI